MASVAVYQKNGCDLFVVFWRVRNGCIGLKARWPCRAISNLLVVDLCSLRLTYNNSLCQHSTIKELIPLLTRQHIKLICYMNLEALLIISSIRPACCSNPIPDPAVNLSVTPELALNLSVAHVTVGGAIRFF